MKETSIGVGTLQIENATQRTISIIGGKGSGKSQTMKMLAYSAPIDLPCYIFDPLGKIQIEGFQTLRITKKTAINKEAIQKIAEAFRKVKDTKIIFSFNDLLQKEIVLFMNTFFQYWKPHNCMIFVDEIQDITPNQHMGMEYAEDFERAVRHWRNENCGFVIATQRPSFCSTKVLALTDFLVLYRITWKQDKKYIEELVSDMLTEQETERLMQKIQTKSFLEGYTLDFMP